MLGCRIVSLYFERGPTSAKRITSEKMGEERRRRGTTWEDRGEAVAPAGKSGWAPGDGERDRAVGQGESGWACMRPGEDGGGGGERLGEWRRRRRRRGIAAALLAVRLNRIAQIRGLQREVEWEIALA